MVDCSRDPPLSEQASESLANTPQQGFEEFEFSKFEDILSDVEEEVWLIY
jgi:hypothetical protein